MVTIRDVARQSGVSVATVSRVLNNSALVSPDTREAVMKAVTQLGYRPNANAQALATQVSDTIGVVVMDVSDAFFGALVKAVDMVAQQHQKYVLIGNSYHEAEKERHAIEVLIRQRCNALIVHSKALSDRELAEFMDQIPGMVLINRLVPGYAHRCVCLDNISGAKMATRMLLNNGHQRIGYLASSHRIEDDTMRKEGARFTESYVAHPGCSEHQTGLAIDLGERREEIDFIRPDFPYTGICQTFRELAPQYGFVERYPKGKEGVTGIAWEPWHFRYVGCPHAQIMTKHGWVLEEYLDYLKEMQLSEESGEEE